MDSLMYVREKPWEKLGHHYDSEVITADDIVNQAGLNWQVADIDMRTELHPKVQNYRAVYRTDDNSILGVINKANPVHVQNIDAFGAFQSIIGNKVHLDTVASYDGGATVLGFFKIDNKYKVLDDDVEHYFVLADEHLKPDGKITIINSPVRVICSNILTSSLDKRSQRVRIEVSPDPTVNAQLASRIIEFAGDGIGELDIFANKLVEEKVSAQYVSAIMDELFPFIEAKAGDDSMHAKANEKIQYMRDVFTDKCMNADDLQNYKGTKYQVYQSVIDFSQHYYNKADNAYSLKYRMGSILGSVDSTQPIGLTAKFLKVMDKIAA